jgi:hypothetical protein
VPGTLLLIESLPQDELPVAPRPGPPIPPDVPKGYKVVYAKPSGPGVPTRDKDGKPITWWIIRDRRVAPEELPEAPPAQQPMVTVGPENPPAKQLPDDPPRFLRISPRATRLSTRNPQARACLRVTRMGNP